MKGLFPKFDPPPYKDFPAIWNIHCLLMSAKKSHANDPLTESEH